MWMGILMFVQDYMGLERWIEHERAHWVNLSPCVGGLIAVTGFLILVVTELKTRKDIK